MSSSATRTARFQRRVCARKGHVHPFKAGGRGQWVRLPCERCGQPPPTAVLSGKIAVNGPEERPSE